MQEDMYNQPAQTQCEQRAVPIAMDYLDNSVAVANISLQELAGRLQIVVRKPTDPTTDKPLSPVGNGAPLADDIRAMGERVRQLRDVIDDLLDRLEL